MKQSLLMRLSEITEEEASLLQSGGRLDRSLYTAAGDFIINPDRLSAHRLGEGGRQIALRTHTRFVEFPLHGHEYVEMMYVCSGSVTHIIGEDTVVLGEGDLLILSAHTRHRVLAAGREDVAVNLILSVDFLSSFYELLRTGNELGELVLESLRREGKPCYLHYHISHIPPMGNLMENLFYSLVEEQSTPQSIFRRTLELLFEYLILHPASLKQKSHRPDKSEMMREQVLSYIGSCYPTATLTELAQRMGFSPQYLSEWIALHMGDCFKGLLQEKRLEAASHLLLTTDLSVSEIMAAVGYENSSYFHRIFRSRYGATPLTYRSKAKGEAK